MSSSFRTTTRRAAAAAAAGAALAAAACKSDPVLVGVPAPSAGAAFMARYVAIGNSITAGYQSSGISDSTQRRSYPRMLAIAAGATFNYPSFNDPGCPAPVVNFLTQVRTTGDTASSCGLRRTSSITTQLNDVAVPGANSFDAIGAGFTPGAAGSLTTGGYSVLTTLILGGQSQLQRAVQLDPTFATVWIGNNDVLAGALTGAGDTTRATTVANFTNNYRTLVNGLVAGSPNLKGGVLISVVDVTNTPLLIPIAVFNPNVAGSSQAAYGAVLGVFGVTGFSPTPTRPATFRVGFNSNCTGSNASIAFPALATLARTVPASATGFTFDCSGASPVIPGVAATAQTNFLVTDVERTIYVNRVSGYNAYIRAKADSLGWGYLDANGLLGQLRAQGAIPLFPNLANPTAPFATAAGRFVTNDGVHPSTSAHYLLANALIGVINAKYGTSLGANIRTLTPADTLPAAIGP